VAHESGFDLSDFPSVERWVSRTEVALNLPHAKEAA
ncbi:MAG TPA: glutathione S-transferase family protein, partial [Hyphomonas sp.]|nr:glutathione S-transferase family protein [Hyphomonas sp.]